MRQTIVVGLAMGALALAGAGMGWAGQPLETESARMLGRGVFELEGGVEHQRSSAGLETAVPFAIEYGLTGRLQLLAEPVLYTAIHDAGMATRTGIGDLEVTLTSLLSSERSGLPGIAVAGELKIPTARDARIGSGKADYTAYLIASRRAGAWDTHAHLGYTLIGRPRGAQVNNVVSFALAEELHLNPRIEAVAEITGSTAALRESAGQPAAGNESAVTPEIGGTEVVGTLGARYHVTGATAYSLGLSIDNNGAVLVHPGITLKW